MIDNGYLLVADKHMDFWTIAVLVVVLQILFTVSMLLWLKRYEYIVFNTAQEQWVLDKKL